MFIQHSCCPGKLYVLCISIIDGIRTARRSFFSGDNRRSSSSFSNENFSAAGAKHWAICLSAGQEEFSNETGADIKRRKDHHHHLLHDGFLARCFRRPEVILQQLLGAAGSMMTTTRRDTLRFKSFVRLYRRAPDRMLLPGRGRSSSFDFPIQQTPPG